MGFFSALIGGGASLLGGLFRNKAAKSAASKQMAFQERMSNTQYQRGMADMRKAGLNPILAYKQGGAGAPGGSSYTPENIGNAAVAGGTSAATTGLAATRLKEDLKNIAANTAAQVEAANLSRAQAGSAAAQARNTNAQTLIAAENLASAKAQSSRAKLDQKFWNTGSGKVLRAIDLVGQSLNPFASATGNSARTVIDVNKYRTK